MIVMTFFCLRYVLNDFPMLLIDYLEPEIENNKIFSIHNNSPEINPEDQYVPNRMSKQ